MILNHAKKNNKSKYYVEDLLKDLRLEEIRNFKPINSLK
jgi:hypothetical protein